MNARTLISTALLTILPATFSAGAAPLDVPATNSLVRFFSARADRKVDGLVTSGSGLSLRLIRPLDSGRATMPLAEAGDWIADLIEGRATLPSRADLDTVVQSVATHFDFTEVVSDERILPFFDRLAEHRASIDFSGSDLDAKTLWTLRNAHVALLMAAAHRREVSPQANVFVQDALARWLYEVLSRMQQRDLRRSLNFEGSGLTSALETLMARSVAPDDAKRVWRVLGQEINRRLPRTLARISEVRLAQDGLRWEFVGGVSSAATLALVIMALRGTVEPNTLQAATLYGFFGSVFMGPFAGRTLFDLFVKPRRLARMNGQIEAFVTTCDRRLLEMDSASRPKL